MVSGWVAAAGEFEVLPASVPGKIILVFRGPPIGQRTSLYSWTIEEKYFKLPSLLDELLDIASRFIATVLEGEPALGWSQAGPLPAA